MENANRLHRVLSLSLPVWPSTAPGRNVHLHTYAAAQHDVTREEGLQRACQGALDLPGVRVSVG